MGLSTHTLQTILQTWSYPAVALFVGIESSGIPFPGETMLVVAAVYAGSGHLNIALVIAAAALGAIAGDNVGYLAGRLGGRPLVDRYGHYVRLNDEKLDAAQRFFDRHGDKTVFFGRFVAVLRAWAAFLAGLNHMPWRRFVVFNAAGGVCWATLYGIIAYKLGQNLPLLHRVLRAMGIAGFVAAAIVIAVVLAVRFRSRIPWVRSPRGSRPGGSGGTALDVSGESESS